MAGISDSRCNELMAIGHALFTEKRSWDNLCQEVAENVYPMRADFTTERYPIGSDFARGLMESSPVLARETLGNFIEAVLRQGHWFEVGTGDENRDKRPSNAVALKALTRNLRQTTIAPWSRFGEATKILDMDYVAFGQNCYSWEASEDRTHMVLRAWHPKSCAWMLDESDGIYAVFRKMTMTARIYRQKVLSGRWKPQNSDGVNGVPSVVETAAEREPMKKFNLMHVLAPTDMIYGSDGKKMRDIRKPFISIYIDLDNQVYLNESGSAVFNYGGARWRTLTGFGYGFSPAALNSLPDARMIQDLSRIILEQGEKAVDPPLIGSGEIFVRDLNFYAGGFTQVDLPEDARLQDKMTTLETSGGIGIGLDLKQDVRAMLSEAWLLNKLYMPNVREMTAYETDQRVQEFRRAALPFFSPIDASYHGPLLDMLLQMKMHMGEIDPMALPSELHGADTRFTFNSPLNEAEGRKMVAALQESIQLVGAAAQIDNTVANLVDFREATMDGVRGTGAPPEWFYPEKVRKAKDQEAEQAKRLQQAAQLAQGGAGVAADVANATIAARNAGIA